VPRVPWRIMVGLAVIHGKTLVTAAGATIGRRMKLHMSGSKIADKCLLYSFTRPRGRVLTKAWTWVKVLLAAIRRNKVKNSA